MNKIIVLILWSLCSYAPLMAQSPTTYASLYKKAYNFGNTNPDSAIYYAQQALKLAQNNKERINAHWLKAYYAHRTGYYSLAIQDYKKAYDYSGDQAKKAIMLKDIAFCYAEIGDHNAAIPIAVKATQNFARLGDTVRLIRSLNLLGNCYRTQKSYWAADSSFQVAFRLISQKSGELISDLYGDFAMLQAAQLQYNSAIQYQKLSLTTLPQNNLNKESIILIKLTRFYLQAEKLDSAQYYLTKALVLRPKSLATKVHLYATKGLLHFMNREIAKGQAAYQVCDTVLNQLSAYSQSMIQQKFARKTAYEAYHLGYKTLNHLWFYSNDKERFAQARDWFKQRMDTEQGRYKDIEVSVALKDSLVIARTAPKTKVVKKLNPWWWVAIVVVMGIFGWVMYKQRIQSLRASEDFIKAIKASPIKGFDHPKPKEIAMLAEIESRIKRQLRLKEIKILLMIARQNNYNQIHLATGIAIGTIKSTVKRLKDLCKVENIRDLM